MKKIIMMGMVLVLMLTGCGARANTETATATQMAATSTETMSETATVEIAETDDTGVETASQQQEGKKSLVIYFNYSDNIDTTGLDADAISSASLSAGANGNTENLKLMAQEIADKKNADVFPVKINELYPAAFDELAPKARDDVDNGTSFTFQSMPENLEDYDVVYVGSPIWWYELPQVMKVFIHDIDLSGKTVVPFGIHRGSGFSGIIDEYKAAWPDAKVVEGFTISADKKNSEVKKSFDEFLDGLEF